MQENKFENQVRESMDQLHFDPKETIWENVSKNIQEGRKKRRPLFWLFFLAGSALLGTGYLLKEKNNMVSVAPKPNLKEWKPTSFSKEDLKSMPAKTVGGNKVKTVLQEERNPVIADLPGQTRLEIQEVKTMADGNEENASAAAIDLSKQDPPKISQHAGIQPGGDTALSAVKMEKVQKKDAVWKIGFTLEAGISNIHQTSSGNDIQNFVSSGPNGTITNPRFAPIIHSGFSFVAGAYIGRKFTSRLSASIGLNYHYASYQSSIANTLISPGNYYAPMGLLYASGDGSGTGTHAYTNQFHFIELPLLADLSLNKNEKLPIVFEGGFSFAWKIASNALYFDPASNLYYKNSSLFNETQWNASAAILFGLSHHQLFIGPQFQYGLSSLLNDAASSPQHLYSFGLKITFNLPGR